MTKVIYECGCTSGGDLISPYCLVHTNMPIIEEIDDTTTKKQEKNIMEQRNKTCKDGHIETATEASRTESPTKHDLNSQYGVAGQAVRPMIQFVPHVSDDMIDIINENIDYIGNTTESKLKDIRESMTFTRAKKTIRRTGWYFTESYAPCGSADSYPRIGREDIGV